MELGGEDRAGGGSSAVTPNGQREPGSRYRDALRLLFILTQGSDPTEDPTGDAVRIFRAEKRLMAMDFLVRYPDYLADALLDLYDQTSEQELLEAVRQIFLKEEPSVRLVRMVRWRHGAYQNVDDALSMLSYYGLVRPMQLSDGGGKVRRYEYLISAKALAFLEDTVREHPELAWYRDRLALVMRVAHGKSGTALKEWQYEHPEYGNTMHGDIIASISSQVEKRLARIDEANA